MLDVKDLRALENMVLVVWSPARQYRGYGARASWTVWCWAWRDGGFAQGSETDSWLREVRASQTSTFFPQGASHRRAASGSSMCVGGGWSRPGVGPHASCGVTMAMPGARASSLANSVRRMHARRGALRECGRRRRRCRMHSQAAPRPRGTRITPNIRPGHGQLSAAPFCRLSWR